MNHSLIPSLRFENYHTDWCYFPMKAFADIDKTSLKKDTDSNFEFSYISLSDVKNQKISRELEKHTFNDAPSRARRIIKSGDILFSTVRPNLQGFALVCNEYKNCIASTGFAVISTDETVNAYFIFQSFFTKRFADQVDNLVVGSNYPAISSSDVKALKIALPHVREQQKIASFLTSVDSKISQLTEKHRLLKEYKKGVMQQIFSQQLRLKDEDGKAFPEWEEQLLADIAGFSKGKGISKSDISIDGKTKCIRYGELYTTYGEVIETVMSATNIPESELILSQANDVIVPSSGETQWDIATAACVQVSGVAYSGDLTIIRSQLNGVFLSYYLNSAKKRDIAALSQGSSVIHLYSSHMKFLKIKVPCLEEQQKIAQFLQSIDKKIDTVAQQVEQTKQFKKGLLQQMFV